MGVSDVDDDEDGIDEAEEARKVEAAWASLPSIDHPKPGEPIDIFFMPTENPDRRGPDELSLMFPAIMEAGSGSRYDKSTPSGRISRDLREAGVPYLQCADDTRGFKWRGMIRQYLIVNDFAEWRRPLRQADFERLMAQFPTYGTLTARAKT